eukprot:TRINITY_DN27255_c0_g1_i4.p1 TRINITY_DN27255_c0_g1~~TRINITY_DN27255_c0_g1_i4.p1  ORF type:complete len:536 (-),score=109.69 TRINITY_DN27255_c0_g1_i4:70-1542(-)
MAAVADDVALANLLGGPSVVAADGAAAKNAANVQNWRDDACVNELLQQPPLQIEKLLQQAGHLRQQPELASFEDPFDQSRDVATLLAAMEPTPTWSAGGASRRRPAIAESQQRRRDDNVLSQILFGESPSASPVNVARDDAALAGALSLPGSRAVVKDDAVLAKLLSMEEEKQVVLQTPLLEIVEGLARDVRQALAKAEVVAGGHGRGDKLCQLSRPMGLAVDASGAVVVADNGNGRLVRWARGATQGQVVSNRDRQLFVDVIGVALDRSGDMFASAGGALLRVLGEESNVVARGHWPTCVTVESGGAILFTDTFDHRVVRCLWSGGTLQSEVVAGGNGSGSRRNQLHRPFGVAVDRTGAVLVVDSGNHRVVRWAPGARAGEVVAGGHGQGCRLEQLNYPRGLALDAAGNLLVCDTLNHRVVRWVPGARRGEVVFGGRGQGSGLGQLNKPAAVAFDGGTLFIADSGNNRVMGVLLPPRASFGAKSKICFR